MIWTDDGRCKSRLLCNACRTMPDWGKARGVPEVCPYGITVETLPKRPKPKPDPAYLTERLAACEACEADCPMKLKTACQLKALLKRPGMACPAEKWLPVVVGVGNQIVDPGPTSASI